MYNYLRFEEQKTKGIQLKTDTGKVYFIFSDIHGNFHALKKALEESNFDEDNPNHILVSAGDYFDRGTSNDRVLEFLQYYKDLGRFYGIRGNHDDFLIGYMRGDNHDFDINHNGLGRTIYDFCKKENIYPEYFFYHYNSQGKAIDIIRKRFSYIDKFLEELYDFIEIDNYFITHSGLSNANEKMIWLKPDWQIDNWSMTPIFIKKFPLSEKYDKDKVYVFGHWHAYDLRQMINGEKSKFTDEEFFKKDNFIGIDMCTTHSKKTKILVLDYSK